MPTRHGYRRHYCSARGLHHDVSGDDTAKIIVGAIDAHMANLLAQTTAYLEANANQINALLQQRTANNNKLNQQQQAILQQMAMLSTNPPLATMA
jgi:hypothetical protein